MTRYPLRSAAFVITVSLALHAPGLSAISQSPQLEQATRTWQAAMELAKQGSIRDAIVQGEIAFGAAHPLWAANDETRVMWAERLAQWHQQLGELRDAIQKRIIARDSLAAIFGEGHWIAREARLMVVFLEWEQGASLEQLQRLDEAGRQRSAAASLNQKRQSREAAASAEKALEILTALFGTGDPRTVHALETLALVRGDLSDWTGARALYEQALEITRLSFGEHSPRAANLLTALGSLYQDMGDVAKAEAVFKEAIETGKAAYGRLHASLSRAFEGLGNLYATLGDYPRGEASLLQALAFERDTYGAEHVAVARVLTNLGLLYRKWGDLAKAEAHYEQALVIQKKTLSDESVATAGTSMNLGMLYRSREEHTRALPLIEHAQVVTARLLGPLHERTILATSNLASALESTGDYARAGPLYEQALAAARETLGPAHHDTLIILNNLAVMHAQLGDRARTESLYRQVLTARRDAYGSSHPDVASALMNLGLHYLNIGAFARAELHLTEALEINRKLFGDAHLYTAATLGALGALDMNVGRVTRAQTRYEQALAIRRAVLGEGSLSAVPDLNNLALIHSAKGDVEQAGALQEQALALARDQLGPDHHLTAEMTMNLARIRAYAGNHAAALDFAGSALRSARKNMALASVVQSDRQQLAMAASLRAVLDDYLSFAPAAAAPAEDAWDHVIAWKGMIFARQRSARAASGRPELRVKFAELQSVASELARLALRMPEGSTPDGARPRLAELSQRKERLEADLTRESAAFRQAVELPTARSLMASLPADTAIVDFLEYFHQPNRASRPERHLLVFIGTRAGARMIPLGAVAPLSEAIDEWRAGYGTMAASLKAAAFMRGEIWLPIERAIADTPDVRRIVLSPDGIIGRLPIGALPGKTRGTYVLDDWIIATIPATQLLPEMLSAKEATAATVRGSLLVLGNVDYGAGTGTPAQSATGSRRAARADAATFDPLPGTLGEIEAIGAAYRRTFGTLPTMLHGAGAAESAVRHESPRHRYLHLATHGFFAAPQFQSALEGRSVSSAGSESLAIAGYHPGLLSGLVLAGANKPAAGDDGILTAEEVATLDLSGVDLAVLSACETGLGQIAGGEGLLGLQRAFQTAGARTVIATMWKVDDEATRALMGRFYENLWTKKMGKLDALRDAQMWIRKERPSPFYWAAFVMSGDWR